MMVVLRRQNAKDDLEEVLRNANEGFVPFVAPIMEEFLLLLSSQSRLLSVGP